MAQAYTELAGFYMDPREAMPKAIRAAETALGLDESLAEAHAALGYAYLVYKWDGPAAAKALLRALALNPTLAPARLNYAAYLSTQAQHSEAIREVRRAVDLDPLSVRTYTLGTHPPAVHRTPRRSDRTGAERAWSSNRTPRWR